MISAEDTYSVDDLVDFLQRLSVHKSVEFLEAGFDGCVIETTEFVIGIRQYFQDVLRTVGIAWSTKNNRYSVNVNEYLSHVLANI